jgi:hypothetical protein
MEDTEAELRAYVDEVESKLATEHDQWQISRGAALARGARTSR